MLALVKSLSIQGWLGQIATCWSGTGSYFFARVGWGFWFTVLACTEFPHGQMTQDLH